MDEQLAQLLRASDFGKAIGSDVCDEILAAAEVQHWPTQTLVFQEGDKAEGIFFVATGMVKLSRLAPDGRETVLTIMEPPGLFAEAAIFLGKYPATATALADTELLFLHRQKVMELVMKHEVFLRFFFTTMAKWLQRLVAKIDQLTLSDGTARLCRYLLAELDKGPTQLDYRVPRVNLSLKKGDLATLLNMNQPSLSRIFRRLQDEKLIDVQAKTIYLNDLEAIRRLTLPPLE
jgi:CRP-like cAMP-binding protein